MQNRPPQDVPSSGSELTESRHSNSEVAMSLGHSSNRVEAPATLKSIATQLINLHLSMETLREQHYDDWNDLVAYINDLQHTQNEPLDSIDDL